MYFIYKIQNNINKKIYIGSSDEQRGLYQRWFEHQQNARLKSRPGYNYPLSKAIRKYGIKNFTYKILITDIETIEDKERLEHQMIVKYHSMVYEHGYNQTSNTTYAFDDKNIRDKHATHCCAISEIDGTIKYYNTVSECAYDLKTDRSSIHACIRGSNRYKTVKGFIIRQWDKENNKIIPNNIPIEEASRLIEIDGKYHTFTDWCKIMGYTTQTIYNRIKKYNIDKKTALLMPRKRKQKGA